jgi:hypothetical protein
MRKIDNAWTVHTHGEESTTKLFSWAEGQNVVPVKSVYSMDHDGTKMVCD